MRAIREQAEQKEIELLSPYASLSKFSRGRRQKEKDCPIRTVFARDRDRILHSKAFRRLKHKTQVFIAPLDDHYRTRLTHVLEVSQVARTLARALKLNEDLTEAITLGHDLGHTPFGHTGERILNKLMLKHFKIEFKHNQQSLRIVESIEKLNLTFEVRDGILRHPWSEPAPQTLEGMVARFSDRIAYINHDIDDSIRAKIISRDDLPGKYLNLLGKKKGQRFDRIIEDIISFSSGKPKIKMSGKIEQAIIGLYKFLFQKVYFSAKAKEESKKACHLIEGLFNFYLEHPHKLPAKFSGRALADFIAGMTDRYAIHKFKDLNVPESFGD